jgi:enoyl-CoA hydratase/carnithine racemase
MAVVECWKEGRIAHIVINRPEAMNALNAEVFRGLHDAMEDFRDNDDLWVAILTGAGDKAFSAGADIKGLVSGFSGKGGFASVRPDLIWKPFIAAINGYCLGGGCELALMCDIRIASENAQFGQPEVNNGFMPAMGGTVRLPRFLPRSFAAEMLLTGNRISAQDALRVGLVSRVVSNEKLMETAMSTANTIITRGPLGVRAVKESMVRGYDMTMEEGLALEQALAAQLRTTKDFVEGANAFSEKRPPHYTGK